MKAAAVADGPRPALSVTLVVDTSGSMSGEPIAQVIDSARKIATLLEARDALAVVSFSSGAGTVPRPPAHRRRPRAGAGGGVGPRRWRQHQHVGGIAHAALLAAPEGDARQVMIVPLRRPAQPRDQHPTGLAAEVRRVRDRGVSVSTLGYGAHHNDDVMVAVADAGGRRYAFVADPKLAAGSFARAHQGPSATSCSKAPRSSSRPPRASRSAACSATRRPSLRRGRAAGEAPRPRRGRRGQRAGRAPCHRADAPRALGGRRSAPRRQVPVTRGGLCAGRSCGVRGGPGGGELDATALVAAAVAQADGPREGPRARRQAQFRRRRGPPPRRAPRADGAAQLPQGERRPARRRGWRHSPTTSPTWRRCPTRRVPEAPQGLATSGA